MRGRWLVVGLIASVMLNLFLIGAGAGIFAIGVSIARQAPAARPGALFWATQDLPQPDRRNVRLMLADEHRQTLSDSDRSLNLRADAWNALAAPQPDVAAVKQQLAQSRQIDIAVRSQVEEKLVDTIATLSPASRTGFANAMRRLLRPPARAPAATNAATNAS